MRILQVGKYYPPVKGGMETLLKSLTDGLAAKGHEVTVLCSAEERQLLRREEVVSGVRVIREGSLGTLFSQPLSPSLPRRLLRLAREHDVINVHTPNPLAETASITLPADVPLVASYHSDIVRQRALLPAYAPILAAFLRRASRIVVATENHIRHSSVLPPFGDKCRVIPYGIEPSDFELTPEARATADELRRSYGPYILFVGRLVGYKGVRYLISAMESVEARLLIVGDGPLRGELEDQAGSLGLLRNKVHFLGKLSGHAALVGAYHGSEIFVLPSVSRNEAFGLVQVEAMACGKPTVATRLDSGVTLVNREGETGLLVEPESPVALARAIQSLLADPAMRERMGRAARERFLALFTREKMVEGYLGLYREIVSA